MTARSSSARRPRKPRRAGPHLDAIERRHMEDALARRNRALELLNRASAEIAASLDPEAVYAATQRAAEQLMPAEAFAITLHDEGRHEIDPVYLFDRGGRATAPRIPIGRGLSGRVMASGQPVCINDFGQATDTDAVHFGHPEHVRSILVVPMQHGGRVIGTLSAQSYRPGAYTPDDQQTLTTLANHAATAIENARLFDAVQRQLAERIRAEQALRASLQEKEVLLQEVHHRVKNNLQIVSSLLNLQADYIADPSARAMFEDSQRRIRSMALIHEQLYRSPDLARLDFRQYVTRLTDQLRRSFAVSAGVQMTIDIADVTLDPDAAIVCGLIINELVSNSLKYAFPLRQAGAIRVELRESDADHLALRVGDDGVGFAEGLDFRATPSLGLQLVYMLSRQLKGTLDREGAGGTSFVITFPRSAKTVDAA